MAKKTTSMTASRAEKGSDEPRMSEIIVALSEAAIRQQNLSDVADERAAELAASRIEIEKFRDYALAILRTIPIPLLVLESDLTVVTANDAFHEKFEVVDAETSGRLIYDLGNGQWDISDLRRLLEDILPNHSFFEHYEITHEFEQIGTRTMLLNGCRMEVEPGSPERIVLVMNDITERKIAEIELKKVYTEAREARHAALNLMEDAVRLNEALRESEEQFRMLADNMQQLAWTCDVLGNVTWYNKRWLDYTGLSFDEMKGWDWSKVQHPDHLDRVVKRIQRSNVSGEPWEDTFPLRGKDGRYRWFLSRALPMRDQSGEIGHWFGTNTDITDLRSAEEALKASERLSRAMRAELEVTYRTAPFGMCQLDRDLRFSRINDCMAEMNGIPAFEHLGRKMADIVPDLALKLAADYKKVLETGVPILDFEVSGETTAQPGVERWWVTSFYPQKDIDGEIIGVNVIVQEITDKKEAEERLQQAQDRFRLAQRAGRVGIFDQDISAGQTYWSETMWHIYGEHVLDINPDSKFWMSHIYPNDQDRVRGKLDKTLADPAASEFRDEFRILRRDGVIRWIEAVATIARDASGKALRMFGVNLDITRRKDAEYQLRVSENQLRLVTDNVPALISYIGADMRYNFVNRTYSQWHGLEQDEMIGASVEQTAGDAECAAVMPHMRRALAGEEVTFELETDFPKAGRRYVHVSYIPDRGHDDQIRGFYGMMSDVTVLKHSQDLLQRANDELELRVEERTRELADSNMALVREMEEREVTEQQKIDLLQRLVSSQELERRRIARDLHDQLGQRLTGLRLKIASLKEATAEHEEISARVERLQEISEQIDSEVSFLAWELRPSALDDLGLVDAIGAFVKEWSKHYEIEANFHSALLSKVRLLPETETHLYRITQEALNNILKHANATLVTVQLEKMPDKVVLVVEDNGKGFKVPNASSSKASGKGLGLVGMSERAALIGGELEIESVPGHGTTIFVKVPMG